MHHHTCEQRVGVKTDTNRRKILKTKGQGYYPMLKTSIGATFVLGPAPKNGQKWPELKFKNRPKLRVSNPLPYCNNYRNPTQPSTKASKIVPKPYLRCQIWSPEERERQRRQFGENRGNFGGWLDGDGGEAPGYQRCGGALQIPLG
ncbi:hypothetical protein L3X38_042646 [Prunus dulcis]|uniref:Uncharacterized protein n=1 Tax=Prunus dulcis TaxID=3755 RepID=A0AAD4UUY8_PRUDU|nr:hypothetical protein L3X38_042646 [Prunus dulcis]